MSGGVWIEGTVPPSRRIAHVLGRTKKGEGIERNA
jgi:hypothetical protein